MKTRNTTTILLAASLVMSATAALAESATANGEVKKIDSTADKIIIKHGPPIKAFDMEDSMTMVYRVKDPAMLKSIKVGDKVNFELDHGTGGYMVTKIQK